ncbi:hypothetical protein SAMN02745130_03713 [Thiothrix eikelboomii]|uniref:Uncharacterized protein n=1 Tax=Thiothrix eikelboomii TaxID=92487 RepID=A0A1T4XZL7_9GAMM|nr:hypothetical protein [Thiothrix eikelboomii]SKA94989.1 hypothetical protein SAMN02745130_03713 [Thiothrix eikelboomii]
MNEHISHLLMVDKETEEAILQKMREFQGVATTLESALGALVVGQYFGWRVLKLLHTPATYRRYEKVLGIKFQDVCPEITEMGRKKSIGYAITEKLGSFWAVIMGRKKVPNKGNLANEDEVKRIAEAFEGPSK